MHCLKHLSSLAVAGLAAAASAQNVQTSAVAVHPLNPLEVWVCNRDNNSVSVVNAGAGVATHEIDVGMRPRTLAFSPDGLRVFVANQRGNVPFDVNATTPFTGTEIRGTVSVIDAAAKTVVQTLTQVGVEPYGIAVAPNGKYFAVSAFRSGLIRFFDALTLAQLAEHKYPSNMNFIKAPLTVADIDADRDGIPDLGDPRGFVIRADSARLYVTHNRSPYVSALDVTLDANGLPTAVALAAKINTNEYPFDPFVNPALVQSIQSQGLPRFLEDVALSPDGTRAVVPHLLHNINHDVNHTFPSFLPGAFANRVYPSVTVIDAASNTYKQPGDDSRRLHSELADPLLPGEYVPFGSSASTPVGRALLGGRGEPLVGGTVEFVVEGLAPGQTAMLQIGPETNVPMGSIGTQYCLPRRVFSFPPSGVLSLRVPNVAALVGVSVVAQAAISTGAQVTQLSNGLRVHLSNAGTGQNRMGHRAGHPSRVAYNPAGNHLLLLNRGSEDLFLYEVAGSDFHLRTVFPPRHGFVPRQALDTATPMGDLPLGLAMVADATTANDDALVYVMNEVTRTLSVLRVGWTTGTIQPEQAQIPTLLQPDIFSVSQRLGDELFEDASRAQTTAAPHTVGEFNNSCASCHFEGGEDGNVWQRPNGPRTTMPVYQGSLPTGLILWKGVRLNMGETGPMFGGENGGTGVFTDAEQQALVDSHRTIPVPLNPNRDPVTGNLTPLAALGQDLFFGTNQTGLNPTLRHGGCAECHPLTDSVSGQPRGFTADFVDPILTGGENLATFDPFCVTLQENIVAINIRNVNSGVNIDFDGDGSPDPDRNGDGWIDIETYTPMNTDKDDDFQRDDANSYPCPIDPSNPSGPKKTFTRSMRNFSIPTKLAVFSTGPYFHDHSALSLRTLVDPSAQALSAVYGSPAYPSLPAAQGLNKFFNEFHDVRGHEEFVPGSSKVQLNLVSTNVERDIDAILAFIQSL